MANYTVAKPFLYVFHNHRKKSQVNKMSMNISYSVKTYNNEGSLENKTCNFSAGGFN